MHNPVAGKALCLSDGTRWCIRGDVEARSWVDSLGSIMSLQPAKMGEVDCTIQLSPSGKLDRKESSLSGDANFLLEKRAFSILEPLVPEKWQLIDFKTLRIWYRKADNLFFCEINPIVNENVRYVNLWRCIYTIYIHSIQHFGLPFHGAMIAKGDSAYILAGSGGVGKSTACVRLPEDWKGCCDDESLVVSAGKQSFRAHPFPTWSEYLYRRSRKTWDVQSSWPLRAFFFIEQSTQDWVEPVEKGEAAGLINRSAMQVCQRFLRILSVEDRRRLSLQIFANACEMARSIPAYRMGMTLTGRFWEMMLDVVGEG